MLLFLASETCSFYDMPAQLLKIKYRHSRNGSALNNLKKEYKI